VSHGLPQLRNGVRTDPSVRMPTLRCHPVPTFSQTNSTGGDA
jgi:hypothetical protein